MLRQCAVALGIMSLQIAPASAETDWSIGQAIDAVIENAIVPSLEDYSLKATATVASMDALCAEGGPVKLAEARDQFSTLVTSWGTVEFLRLGPLMQENRLERTLYWPDRKGRGLRQVQRAVSSEAPEVVEVEALSGQSVAVQGLSALEFVLFGTDSGTLETALGHRCAYGEAIAQNLANVAAETLEAWQADDGIAALWRNPSAENPLFRDENEQLRAFLKILGDGAEVMRSQRLDPFLTSDPFNHKRALFWRSGATMASLSGNFEGMSKLVEASKLEALVDGNNARLTDGMRFELANA
ncbi:MAG: imelysin family protein, partial [Pseudomonadota bacterium]